MKKNWFKIGIVSALLLVSFSVIYHFILFLPTQQESITTQQLITSCYKDGMLAVEKYQTANQTQLLVNPGFHYNQKLGKCFAYFEVSNFMACQISKVILDIYTDNEVLSACFRNDKTENYVDFSVYPPKIIDRIQFSSKRDELLELNPTSEAPSALN